MKHQIGDTVYFVQDDIYKPIVCKIIEYNPDGYGWLNWVKYKVSYGKNGVMLIGDSRSPDVFIAKIYSVDEYNFELDKLEYSEINDHGNGD